MKRRLACFCAAALILLFASCAALASTVVDSLTLPPENPSAVDAGAIIQLDAVLSPEGTGAVVSWRFSNPKKYGKYASILPIPGDPDSCQIRGRAPGRVIVTARAGSRIASTVITINAPQASSLRLNARAVTLNPSGAYSTYLLRAATTPTYHSDSVEWAVGGDPDGAILSIEPSADGKTCLVTAKSDGSETRTCTVTAALRKGLKSAVCQFTVMKIPEKYVRVAKSAVVPRFSSRPLTAVVYPVDAFDKTITWTVVKNPLVASVDPLTGEVTGLMPGTAVIQASTPNGSSARCTVVVKTVRYSSFSAAPSSKVLEKDATFQITTRRAPAYVSYPDVTYAVTYSSNPGQDVVTVDSTGLVRGVNRGYATITVTADGGRVKRYISIKVIDSVQAIPVTISAIGDVMLGGDPRKSSYNDFAALWAKGPNYFFAEIKDELKGIAIANLEIPLIHTNTVVRSSRSYIFRGEPIYAQALAAGGIDGVDLDNNHIMDYGSRGFSATKSALYAQGVSYFGRGGVWYTVQNGIRIGFMGFRPESISVPKMRSHIKSARSRCDILVVSFHWGVEKRYYPTGQQVTYGREAVKAGADLVVGHHSHLISGIELYRGKHIVYGLGTIVSAVERPDDVDTFIYQHTFSVTGTSVTNKSFEIVPVLMTKQPKGSKNDARPVLDSDENRIRNRIKGYSPASNPF